MGSPMGLEAKSSTAPDGGPGSGQGSEAIDGFGVNAGLVEEIRHRYGVDPSSVHASWADLFQSGHEAPDAPALELSPELAEQQARVLRLIHAYRARGHRIAETDPLGGQPSYFPELDPAHYGLGHEDMQRPFGVGDLPGAPVQTLGQILARLRATYCGKVGVEFTHIQDPGRKSWLQKRMEETQNRTRLDASQRLAVLQKLSAAELFERFLHTRFIGQKRFSLEGCESLIPLLDAVVEDAAAQGVRELVIGMAHRGRLNVLSNILGKSLESIFSEFEDNPEMDSPFGSGDVKYHKGFSSDRRLASGTHIHLSLTANPSHLEAVDPVVEGRARAKQQRVADGTGEIIMPVLIHGDAAFAGQGIVAETLNLSKLAGYSTGGTLHVVVNNQIGFTTTSADARSTLYATDVAKMIQAPIFHVNGDEPDAVLHCVALAMAWRRRFREDVVIDLLCYRRQGHNEGDEPSFTQPLLYDRIRGHPSTRERYTGELLEMGILQPGDVERIESDLSQQLARALADIQTRPPGPDEPFEPHGPWSGFSRTEPREPCDSGVGAEKLAEYAERMGSAPADFEVHPKLKTLLERRRRVVADDAPIDWGTAEALAFASLLCEGTPVRLSGQDSVRGTFSQRHATLVDQQSGSSWSPLAQLSPDQARFEAYDSLLSEAAVLGFEYGYSLADPATLTIWEAQFGDFVNGAQVIIDQFITSAHVKWQRMSGLVMLLPHGYEGQGPEHSSARIERFLQGCAGDNLQIVNCTTAAQYFHVLRRQMKRRFRAPLVIFTPKSLLRMREASSRVDDLARGRFRPVIGDPRAAMAPESVRRVVLCSGKLYYELEAARQEREPEGPTGVALLRLEQLYPWPMAEVAQQLRGFPHAEQVVWAQEEPANMGAWTFLRDRLGVALDPGQRLAYAGRPESASTAVGSVRVHRREQAAVIAESLGEDQRSEKTSRVSSS